MTEEQSRIEQIEKEMMDLSKDLHQYRQRLNQLHTALHTLKGTRQPLPVTPKQPGTSFSIENFIGLRLLHLVGIVVLVIGLSIGVKYAIDEKLISEVMRISLAYVAGGVLFFLSWRLKEKYSLFSAILFSGAMASLYFTTYAAAVYYDMFSTGVAFGLMVLMTIYTTYRAIGYNRQEIGVLGMAGAYSIPFLVSQNSENALAFFGYMLVINLGIIFISFKKMWKVMSQVAMITTWILFISWLAQRAEQTQWGWSLAFMVVYYLLFITGAVAYHFIRQQRLRWFDVEMIMTNNLALYLAALFVSKDTRTDAVFAEVSGIFCVFTALMAFTASRLLPQEKLLKQALVVQLTLLIIVYTAAEWDGITVTLLWLLLSVALFAWGMYSRQSWLRLASIVVVSMTLLKLVISDSQYFSTIEKIICYVTIGALLLVVSFFYQKFKEKLFGE
jgi:uncharacterized membrane protein